MPLAVRLTPPGRGAVATLRIEGVGALDILQSHFIAHNGKPLAAQPTDRLTLGTFGGPGGEVVVVRRCAGDAVEVHCHGGLAAPAMIEETLARAGCETLAWCDWASRPPQDPFSAAALNALADARTERTASILLDQFNGAFARELNDIRRAIELGDRGGARLTAEAILARAEIGRHLTRPWRIVLAGPPNVGKSSLMNVLAGYDRAIVHPTPGTTRDAVTLTTAVDGWPVEFCDTAGLRAGGDPIERAGIDLARQRLSAADLKILVFDASRTWSNEDRTLVEFAPDAILVHNKCDLSVMPDNRPAGLLTSALHGKGIDELLCSIAGRLASVPPRPGDAVPITSEQIEILKAAILSLERIS